MSSIYERALGADFARLHPQVRRRFGFSSANKTGCIGRGVMDQVWHAPAWTVPFLRLGSLRNILVPERLERVPFTIENYAYVDELGRETVTWLRTFQGPKPRRFDAFMIWSERRGCIVDYLGTHQHLAVDLAFTVDEQGGMNLRSGAQRFYEGPIAFRFPRLFSGSAQVREWFDEAIGRFRIRVDVTNPVFGRLFGYEGTFDAEWVDMSGGVPAHVKPRRTQRRE